MPSSPTSSPRRARLLTAVTCVAATTFNSSFVLAAPKGGKKGGGGGGGGGGGFPGSSGDSDAPSFFYQYEEGSTPSGTPGLWVPTKYSGPLYQDGCILWTHGETASKYWKSSCAEPHIKTSVYLAGAAIILGGLLILYIIYRADKKKKEHKLAIETAFIAALIAMAEEKARAEHAAAEGGDQQSADGKATVVDMDGIATEQEQALGTQDLSEVDIAERPEQQPVPAQAPPSTVPK